MTRHTALLATALITLMLAACGAPVSNDEPASGDEPTSDGGAAGGTCLAGTEDCVDADLDGGSPGPPDLDDGSSEDEDAIREAREMLGEPETEVLERFDDVRLGRRDGEAFELTEDYQPGRKTIATEDDGTGVHRVVEVVVETHDGPETVTAVS